MSSSYTLGQWQASMRMCISHHTSPGATIIDFYLRSNILTVWSSEGGDDLLLIRADSHVLDALAVPSQRAHALPCQRSRRQLPACACTCGRPCIQAASCMPKMGACELAAHYNVQSGTHLFWRPRSALRHPDKR